MLDTLTVDNARLRDIGAVHLPGALSEPDLRSIEDALSLAPSERAGVRLHGAVNLGRWFQVSGPVGGPAAAALGSAAKPVRAILFDKTAQTNWSLAWHQDRTLAVKQRIDIQDFGPWSRKDGMQHVAPPFDILEGMVTLRVHLDRVDADNAPLLIAPGSHKLGRIAEADIPDAVEQCGVTACLAERGDIWLYATPILHASEAARTPRRRRVLQVDYAARDLPGGLEWLGV